MAVRSVQLKNEVKGAFLELVDMGIVYQVARLRVGLAPHLRPLCLLQMLLGQHPFQQHPLKYHQHHQHTTHQ